MGIWVNRKLVAPPSRRHLPARCRRYGREQFSSCFLDLGFSERGERKSTKKDMAPNSYNELKKLDLAKNEPKTNPILIFHSGSIP
jgi:hypothetical protein